MYCTCTTKKNKKNFKYWHALSLNKYWVLILFTQAMLRGEPGGVWGGGHKGNEISKGIFLIFGY